MLPLRLRWGWLLIVSYAYYWANAGWALVFILSTTLTTWAAALLMERETDNSANAAGSGEMAGASGHAAGPGGGAVATRHAAGPGGGAGASRHAAASPLGRRTILILTLLLNFGTLAVLKYTNFAINNLNALPGVHLPEFKWILPFGISFYTFQSMGYLLDVYWKRQEAERNLLKFALFVAFFPQIMQGPIGRYGRLAPQFFKERRFSSQNLERGAQLILWGLFKKMVLADNAAFYVRAIFDHPEQYPGLSIPAILAYSIHLYGDFSGGIDIISGVAVLFGIQLDANFRQPYFATSLTDFWHRWHITLGAWMKDYVFYPLSLSGWMGKFGKWCRKQFGRKNGRTVPIAFANIIVFLIVGIWHGAAWQYIAYGLYNGVIIGISGILAPQFRAWKERLGIVDKSAGWHVFCVLRTFLIVNVSWFFDRAMSLKMAFVMMKNAVTHFTPGQLLSITVGMDGSLFGSRAALGVLAAGCLVLFVVSFMKERGVDVARAVMERPFAARIALYAVMIVALPAFGQPPLAEGGFIYAQF